MRIGYLVSHSLSSLRSCACMIFPLSNSHSAAAIRIIFSSTARFTIGIHAHRIPIVLHFTPICEEVRYTRMMPLKNTAASTAITQARSANHNSLSCGKHTGSIMAKPTADTLTDNRKQTRSSQPSAQILSLLPEIFRWENAGIILSKINPNTKRSMKKMLS